MARAADLRSGAGLALTSRGVFTSTGSLSASGDVITRKLPVILSQNAGIILSNGAVTLDAGGILHQQRLYRRSRRRLRFQRQQPHQQRRGSFGKLSVSLTNRAGTASLGGKVSGKTGVSLSSAGDVTVSGTLVSGQALNGNVTGALTSHGQRRTACRRRYQPLSIQTRSAMKASSQAAQALGLFTTPNFSSIGTLESGRAFALTAQRRSRSRAALPQPTALLCNATNGALDLGAALQGTDVTLSSLGGDLEPAQRRQY